jgi:hypothetical protein
MAGIYKNSHFKPDITGHGGCRRTAQIDELLFEASIPFTEVDFSLYVPKAKNIIHYFNGLYATKNIAAGFKNNYAAGRYLAKFKAFTKKVKPGFFIWESTYGYDMLMGKVLHQHEVPFVALPHNIESLVAGNTSVFSKRPSPEWLTEELTGLKYASHVFTISREEQWLLSVHGINCSYLPYYPTKALQQKLLSIRDRRAGRANLPGASKQLLLLGTFYNKPTRDGYIHILNKIKKYPAVQIHVAGFGSEQLKTTYNQKNITIWGSLNDQELQELLITCDYALIHQEPSSGALTRIPELLIAGIPILANNMAARSYFELDGIRVYNNIDELLTLLDADIAAIPQIPGRPVEEFFFTNHIRSYQKAYDRSS